MGTKSTNSQKCTFFESFYHLRTYEGCKDTKKAFKIAAKDAKMSTESVLEALKEVEKQKYQALDMTQDGAVVVWFKMHAPKLGQIINGN